MREKKLGGFHKYKQKTVSRGLSLRIIMKLSPELIGGLNIHDSLAEDQPGPRLHITNT